MKKHLQTGKEGEEMATAWLIQRGYQLLHRNWRHSYYEIDIIAHKDGILHFVEVKARKTMKYGHPEEAVDRKKLSKLMKAAEVFLEKESGWKRVQYDVLSIRLAVGLPPEIELFEDLYLW